METQPCSAAKNVTHFATVRKPSSKFFVRWWGSPLVLLQSKDSLHCETVPINAPKAETEGNLKKKKKKSLWQSFLIFLAQTFGFWKRCTNNYPQWHYLSYRLVREAEQQSLGKVQTISPSNLLSVWHISGDRTSGSHRKEAGVSVNLDRAMLQAVWTASNEAAKGGAGGGKCHCKCLAKALQIL